MPATPAPPTPVHPAPATPGSPTAIQFNQGRLIIATLACVAIVVAALLLR